MKAPNAFEDTFAPRMAHLMEKRSLGTADSDEYGQSNG